MKKYVIRALSGAAVMIAALVISLWPTNVQHAMAQNWNQYPWVKSYPNDTSTGTTQFKLACQSSGKAVVCGTGATAGYLGVCVQNCGTTGSALIAFAGLVPVIVDATTTVDNYVINSTTVAGDAKPSGAATFPAASIIVGKVQTASTGAASVSLIDLNTEIQGVSPSGSGMADPGGNGVMTRTSNNVSAQATANDINNPLIVTSTGTVNTYIVTLSPAATSYTKLCFTFKANFTNTGAAQVNVNSLGAVGITKNGITATALASGDIGNGQTVTGCYDGTQVEMQSPLANAPSSSGCVVLGASGDFFIPPFVGGLITMSQQMGSGAVNAAGISQYMGVNRVYIPCAWTPSKLNFALSVAGGSGCKLSVGIYDTSGTKIIDSGILTDSTTVPCNSTGWKQLTASTTPAATGLGTLRPAGYYYLASTSNENTANMNRISVANDPGSGTTQANFNFGTVIHGYANTGVATGALPGTLPSLTANAVPMPVIRFDF